MTDHYTAVIEVTHSKDAPPPSTNTASRPFGNAKEEPKSRLKKDLTRIVVRAESIEKLRDKLGAHIALLEDYEEPA